MSVPEVKQALYSMDEKALAPELLGQLLAFAPSKTEVSSILRFLPLLTVPLNRGEKDSSLANFQ